MRLLFFSLLTAVVSLTIPSALGLEEPVKATATFFSLQHHHRHHHKSAYWGNHHHSIAKRGSTCCRSTSTRDLLVTNLRGGGGGLDSPPPADELISAAYDWCINLGAPAALVAGAVVATLYENLRSGDLEIKKADTTYVKFAKKGTNLLLYSAFALQIVSIFVTTITGTMLLSRDADSMIRSTTTTTTTAIITTPLGFLREYFEFEYLTSRLSFLQGLLNWLAAVALEHTIPRPSEGIAALRMNQFIASSLITLILTLFAFYNGHLTFYNNYFQMCQRWLSVTVTRFLSVWPRPRPLALLYIPSGLMTIYLGIRAMWLTLPDKKEFSKDT